MSNNTIQLSPENEDWLRRFFWCRGMKPSVIDFACLLTVERASGDHTRVILRRSAFGVIQLLNELELSQPLWHVVLEQMRDLNVKWVEFQIIPDSAQSRYRDIENDNNRLQFEIRDVIAYDDRGVMLDPAVWSHMNRFDDPGVARVHCDYTGKECGHWLWYIDADQIVPKPRTFNRQEIPYLMYQHAWGKHHFIPAAERLWLVIQRTTRMDFILYVMKGNIRDNTTWTKHSTAFTFYSFRSAYMVAQKAIAGEWPTLEDAEPYLIANALIATR